MFLTEIIGCGIEMVGSPPSCTHFFRARYKKEKRATLSLSRATLVLILTCLETKLRTFIIYSGLLRNFTSKISEKIENQKKKNFNVFFSFSLRRTI